MKGEALAIRGLHKSYGDVDAVRDLTLDVQAGEFLSILGPSGSGKTTLLMMLAGFEAPSAGRIFVGTQDVTHRPPNKRHLGMVFQKYALFPHMSVARNIAFPLRMRGFARAEIAGRVGDALELVQMADMGGRYPHQLSGGQQQRVAVARALVFEPPVLLMDEPLGALDKKLREIMQFEIKALQKRLGVTVVYVTHDQEEALTMSDRVAVMSEGRLAQLGTPQDLYQKPATPFVADFVGRMNFLEGEYVGGSSENAVLRLSPEARLLAPTQLNGSSSLLTEGKKVRIALRPESLRLVARGAGGHGAFPAEVKAAVFAGSFHIFVVSICGRESESIQIQVPAHQSQHAFQSGDAVDVVPDLAGLRLFPAPGETLQ